MCTFGLFSMVIVLLYTKEIEGGRNMQAIATFEKVSFTQFKKDWVQTFGATSEQKLKEIYEAILLPKRATKSSAGYDIFAPISFVLNPQREIFLPTGIRCHMDEGWTMLLFSRSGLGTKFYVRLATCVSVIDGDYYYANNEGHIFIKVRNESTQNVPVEISAGSGFAQGVFVPFGVTTNDTADGERVGGFGSTTKA